MFQYLGTPRHVQTLVILPCMCIRLSRVSLEFSFSQRPRTCIIGSKQAAPAENLSCQKPHLVPAKRGCQVQPFNWEHRTRLIPHALLKLRNITIIFSVSVS